MTFPIDPLDVEIKSLPVESRIFLDYDGTLVELSPDPETTYPDADLISLLDAVSARYETYIATGRSLNEIRGFLGDRYNIIALHGAVIVKRGEDPRYLVDAARYIKFCDSLFARREEFFSRYPGIKITNKQGGIVFILWRLSAEDTGRLVSELQRLASESGMDLYLGKRIAELRIPGINKGTTIRMIRGGSPALIAGDDATDEDSFRLNPDAVTIKVGDGDTSAKYRVRDVKQFREILGMLSVS